MSQHFCRAALALLFADEHIAAFDKPSGLLVHRGFGTDAVTATDLARDALGPLASPVHRLDRATSGVLLFARSSPIAARLAKAFEEGLVQKSYLALVRGNPPDQGLIDYPIPRREGGPRVPAVTAFRTLARAQESAPPDLLPDVRRVSLVLAKPRTGRMHQVRRHLKHIHHPLIGDANYGKGLLNRLFATAIGLHRLALHAAMLSLPHPVTGAPLLFRADVPIDLAEPFRRLCLPATPAIE